jgi:ParB family chromosome partitioning protein
MTDTATVNPAMATDGGTPVDGADAQAGPPCANDPANPACARRMITVAKLTAHPGNVREDLGLTDEFCASVAENGVRVPLLITADTDGGFRVIEGHRRLAAAVKAGLAEVPYDLDGDRAADEAGQFLDMVTANSQAYRKNFTALEEATALFAAHEAGATRTRIRKATGRKPDQVKAALAAGGLSMSTREQVAGLDRDEQLTLDELAVLAEFEDDPDAMAELMRAIAYNYPLEHAAERLRQDKAEAADHERIRAELEAAGCPVTDQIVAGSMLLSSLAHDGADLTEDTHRSCPGHAAFFRSHDRRTPVFYCTDPAAHGHVSRWAHDTHPRALSGTGGDADDRSSVPGVDGSGGLSATDSARVPEPVADPAVEQARRLVADGNKAWAAAAEVRKRWVAQLLWRRTAPKQVIRFVAQQLFTMPDALRRGLPAAAGRVVFIELTGKPLEAVLRDCDTSPIARMPLLALAPIAIAYESEMAGDGDRRNTWRTDAWAPCSRKDAAGWLSFLAGLGYPLSAIEQAVADSVPYTGDGTPPESGTGGDGAPEEPSKSADADDADSAEAAEGDCGGTSPGSADLPRPAG